MLIAEDKSTSLLFINDLKQSSALEKKNAMRIKAMILKTVGLGTLGLTTAGLSTINFRDVKSQLCFAMLAVVIFSFTNQAIAADQPFNDVSRGKLLYSLHCMSCHNEQVHWQAHKKVSDWPSLLAQVKLWQGIANLKWTAADIDSVAKHLNTLYYHYPVPNTLAHKK